MGKDTDFNYGANVAEVDAPSYECMGRCVCSICGKFHGYCSEVGVQPEKEDNMINRGESGNTGNNKGQRKRNGLPFLSTENASSTKRPGNIVAARVEDDSFRPGHQVVALKIAFNGQHYLYNLRTNNPTLDSLCSSFGDDESQWNGKDIFIFNEEDTFNGKIWLRMEAAEPEPKSRRK